MIIRNCTQCGEYRAFRNKADGLCRNCTDNIYINYSKKSVADAKKHNKIFRFFKQIYDCSFIKNVNRTMVGSKTDIFIDVLKIEGDYVVDFNVIGSDNKVVKADNLDQHAVPFLLYLKTSNADSYKQSHYYHNIKPENHIV